DLVVVIHQDAPDVVARSLRALAASMGPDWGGRVVLVQNASPPLTAQMMQDEVGRAFPAAHRITVSSSRNLGFAAGVHLGGAHTAAPYVGVFNPDGVTRPETVARLAGVLDRDDQVFMAGARVGSTSAPDAPRPLPPLPVAWLPGTAMLFRRKWFLDIGGVDPRLFLYCRGVGLPRRARAPRGKAVGGVHPPVLHRGRPARHVATCWRG